MDGWMHHNAHESQCLGAFPLLLEVCGKPKCHKKKLLMETTKRCKNLSYTTGTPLHSHEVGVR